MLTDLFSRWTEWHLLVVPELGTVRKIVAEHSTRGYKFDYRGNRRLSGKPIRIPCLFCYRRNRVADNYEVWNGPLGLWKSHS
jgi:hypothetical protein